jgi:hypothetical protein
MEEAMSQPPSVGVDVDGDGVVDFSSSRPPTSFTDAEGKLGWVGMTIIGATLASLIYSIVWYRKQMIIMEKQIKEEKNISRELLEVKTNLQAIMGSKYKKL